MRRTDRMQANNRTVVVLGASDNAERYSFMATQRLLEKGFSTVPVNPKLRELLGVPVKATLAEVEGKVDTVTVYLSPKRSTPLAEELIALGPRRVVINPGAENPDLEKRLDEAGLPWMHACTLVLLSTGSF
jgi:predicted CoA-binding protein